MPARTFFSQKYSCEKYFALTVVTHLFIRNFGRERSLPPFQIPQTNVNIIYTTELVTERIECDLNYIKPRSVLIRYLPTRKENKKQGFPLPAGDDFADHFIPQWSIRTVLTCLLLLRGSFAVMEKPRPRKVMSSTMHGIKIEQRHECCHSMLIDWSSVCLNHSC